MSLTALITTVQDRHNDLSEEIIISLLDKIGNEEEFTIEILTGVISPEEASVFLEILIEENVIAKKYRYECEYENGEIETASSKDEDCLYCNQEITSKSHIIKEVFFNNDSKIINKINDYILLDLENYVDKPYLGNLKILKKKLDSTIPFLGSGISIPLGIPNWIGLIKQLEDGLVDEDLRQFNKYLDNGDVFNALDLLAKESVTYNEESIKSFIKDYIDKNFITELADEYHNINDILNLNSDFYITTNYDSALNLYKDKYSSSPLVLSDLNDVHDFISEKSRRILHLHGIYDRKETMIVTNKDYKRIYEDESNKDKIKALMSQKPFLFIGFSFTDKYFDDLYTNLHNNLGGEHFIILSNLHKHAASILQEKGLKPISVKVNGEQSIVLAIKKIINYLLR